MCNSIVLRVDSPDLPPLSSQLNSTHLFSSHLVSSRLLLLCVVSGVSGLRPLGVKLRRRCVTRTTGSGRRKHAFGRWINSQRTNWNSIKKTGTNANEQVKAGRQAGRGAGAAGNFMPEVAAGRICRIWRATACRCDRDRQKEREGQRDSLALTQRKELGK